MSKLSAFFLGGMLGFGLGGLFLDGGEVYGDCEGDWFFDDDGLDTLGGEVYENPHPLFGDVDIQ